MATLNAANLTLVIKATNDASKVLKFGGGAPAADSPSPSPLDSGSSPE